MRTQQGGTEAIRVTLAFADMRSRNRDALRRVRPQIALELVGGAVRVAADEVRRVRGERDEVPVARHRGCVTVTVRRVATAH